MKLKTLELEGKVYAEVDDGKPIYLADDGKPIAFDAPHTVATIARLNGEAKGFREAKEGLEGRLKAFEGIEDPDAARSALDTIRNLKEGDLIKAGEVEAIKVAAKKAADEQVAAAQKQSATKLKEAEKRAEQMQALYTGEKIGGVFSRSKFIADKCTIPAPMMQSTFGAAFRIEDGRVVAYDGDNKVFSRSKPGEVADPDEALEILVDQYPYRDNILKGSGSSGSGARPSTVGGRQQMSRAEFNKLPPMQQRDLSLKHVQLYD